MEEDGRSQPSRRPLQFLIGSLLMWTAVIGLVLINLMMYREVRQLARQVAEQSRVDSQRWPISAEEVAQQFQRGAALGPLSARVDDVRYSEAEDSYRISFVWTNKKTGQVWSTTAKLEGNGFGEYYGMIQSDALVKSLGSDRFAASVKTPSPLAN